MMALTPQVSKTSVMEQLAAAVAAAATGSCSAHCVHCWQTPNGVKLLAVQFGPQHPGLQCFAMTAAQVGEGSAQASSISDIVQLCCIWKLPVHSSVCLRRQRSPVGSFGKELEELRLPGFMLPRAQP